MKFYSNCYKRFVLMSSWLPWKLYNKIAKRTHYTVREYWIKEDGRGSTMIASAQPLNPPASYFQQLMPGKICHQMEIRRSFDNPYLIVLRHLIKRVLRKITGKDIFIDW